MKTLENIYGKKKCKQKRKYHNYLHYKIGQMNATIKTHDQTH